jgi:hypothetical protein
MTRGHQLIHQFVSNMQSQFGRTKSIRIELPRRWGSAILSELALDRKEPSMVLDEDHNIISFTLHVLGTEVEIVSP